MTADHFDSILAALTSVTPFQVFTLELHGGQRLEVDHPNALILRDGVAVFLAPGGVPVLFDHDSVNASHECTCKYRYLRTPLMTLDKFDQVLNTLCDASNSR